MIEIIGAVVTALLASHLFDKAPYCIWIRKADGSWECPNPAGNSKHRCNVAIRELVAHGVPRQSLVVYPKGFTPPKE